MPEPRTTLAPFATKGARAFSFIDPGPLVDGDLELVWPDRRWIEPLLSACGHPLTKRDEPESAKTTREDVERLLRKAPMGREAGDAAAGLASVYHFWMHLTTVFAPVRIAGAISLRVGEQPDLELYYGHVGYNVYPPARGRHYAARACRLVFEVARRHGMEELWITCDPENAASRRTCEILGASLVEVVNVPKKHVLYEKGQRRKCRYRVGL